MSINDIKFLFNIKRILKFTQVKELLWYLPIYYGTLYIFESEKTAHGCILFLILPVLAIDLISWLRTFKIPKSADPSYSFLLSIILHALIIILACANTYGYFGKVVSSTNSEYIVTGLWECIYFSVVTFTSLGYGDLVPQGFARVIAGLEALFGMGVFAFLIGISASIYYSASKPNKNRRGQ